MATNALFTPDGHFVTVYNLSQVQVWDSDHRKLLIKYVSNNLANPITAVSLQQVWIYSVI